MVDKGLQKEEHDSRRPDVAGAAAVRFFVDLTTMAFASTRLLSNDRKECTIRGKCKLVWRQQQTGRRQKYGWGTGLCGLLLLVIYA